MKFSFGLIILALTPILHVFGQPPPRSPGPKFIPSLGPFSDLKKDFHKLLLENPPPPPGKLRPLKLPAHLLKTTKLKEFSDIYKYVPKEAHFADMNPLHMFAVKVVSHMLLEEKQPEEFLKLASRLKGDKELHPKIFQWALETAKYVRPELLELLTPEDATGLPFFSSPDNFIGYDAIMESEGQECVKVDETIGEDNGDENKLWYFREDIFLNSHHWFWHRAFPTFDLPDKYADRRGELFWYIHQSILARYRSERITQEMSPLEPLEITKEGEVSIYDGYKSHLNSSSSGKPWIDREDNIFLSDLKFRIPDLKKGGEVEVCGMFPQVCIKVDHLRMYSDRLKKALEDEKFIDIDGNEMELKGDMGFEYFANLLEASSASKNPKDFGIFGLHGAGHFIIAYIMDPNATLLTSTGVMGDTSTSMRDPIFYKWHGLMDDYFEDYKQKREPYQLSVGEHPLEWKGVTLDKVEVLQTEGDEMPNYLNTYWDNVEFQLNLTGTNLNPTAAPKKTKVCAKHIDHKDFKYKIELTKDASIKTDRAIVRIFMAPREADGKKLTLEEQRRLFFPLDRFTVDDLKDGKNVIERSSKESTLTVPWTTQLDTLNDKTNLSPNQKSTKEVGYCGCGWPQHMLLPKGKIDGAKFDLFVMVTDWTVDSVPTGPTREATKESCKTAEIYCGIPGKKYPDLKPMGYPFDRKIPQASTLEDFSEMIPNAATIPVTITHTD